MGSNRNTRLPARNKHYMPMPGHPEYTPESVEELKEHGKRRQAPKKKKRRKKRRVTEEAS